MSATSSSCPATRPRGCAKRTCFQESRKPASDRPWLALSVHAVRRWTWRAPLHFLAWIMRRRTPLCVLISHETKAEDGFLPPAPAPSFRAYCVNGFDPPNAFLKTRHGPINEISKNTSDFGMKAKSACPAHLTPCSRLKSGGRERRKAGKAALAPLSTGFRTGDVFSDRI